MRSKQKRTETGPRFESRNPGKGCNATHVARARRWWKRFASRTARRNGTVSPKFHTWLHPGRRRIHDDEGE